VFGGPKAKQGGQAPNAALEYVLWDAKSGDSRIIPFKPGNPQWDPATQQWQSQERTNPAPTGRMALTADGTLLAGYLDGNLRLWDLPAGLIHQKTLRQTKPGASNFPERLLFSPDGRRLWELTSGKSRIFDVTGAEPIGGSIDSSGPCTPKMSRDGRWLGFADGNGLQFINAQTGERHGTPLQPENKGSHGCRGVHGRRQPCGLRRA